MKDRLVSHLNMVFKALSIESASEVYDCTFDKLPDWACHLSHSYRYFVCTSAVDKLDILKKFLGKDINVLGDMLYWYDVPKPMSPSPHERLRKWETNYRNPRNLRQLLSPITKEVFKNSF